LLESPPHIVEVEEIISIVGLLSTSERRWISIFWRAGTPKIARSDSVESSGTIIEEKKELGLGRCYGLDCPSIGPRCHKIQA